MRKYRIISWVVLSLSWVLLASCLDAAYRDRTQSWNESRAFDNIKDAVPKLEIRSVKGNHPYEVGGKVYVPLSTSKDFRQKGVASWYGKEFHGHPTSSGERYDMFKMTAAHPTLPLPSYVKVRNLSNHRAVVVRVNDRGPFLNDRVIDLSYSAAVKLGIFAKGTGAVEVIDVTPVTKETKNISADFENLINTETESVIALRPKLYLQVGAFREADNARQLRLKLKGLEMNPLPILTSLHTGQQIYRVRFGPFPQRSAARSLMARLVEHQIGDYRFVVQ